jgi:hypothetical protein
MTPVELFEDLIRRKIAVPTDRFDPLTMPTAFRSVPLITTY